MNNDLEKIIFPPENQFFIIAGPCVVESEENCFLIAEKLKTISDELSIPFVFKASYKKANRSSINSFSGIGDSKALKILAKVKKKFNVPICTDIHLPCEAEIAAEVADILQIPAFLCRQTELLQAAGKTGKYVNIKKAQFLSAEAMKYVSEKVISTGNTNILLTERGTMFGYQDLVVDFRNIHTMKQYGFPVVLDVTHSLQQPNQPSGVSGGKPEMIEIIAKSGIAAGVNGIFIETHPQPNKAKSDGSNMLKLDYLKDLLIKLVRIKEVL